MKVVLRPLGEEGGRWDAQIVAGRNGDWKQLGIAGSVADGECGWLKIRESVSRKGQGTGELIGRRVG